MSADHKISFFRNKLIRKLKVGDGEIREAECIFTIGTEEVQMGIIRIGTGTIGRTKCVLCTVAGVINPMDQSLLFKSFQSAVERCSVRPGKMSFKQIKTDSCLLINQKIQNKQSHGCGLYVSGSQFFNKGLFVHSLIILTCTFCFNLS